MMEIAITFLGATGTVSGSRYLLEADGFRLGVDCGLFQGVKRIRVRNWQPFPVPPDSIDAVALTDAHLDHSGFLPRLIREGFTGPIWCSHGTRDLCKVLLPDFGESEEELANHMNRTSETRHRQAQPLYSGHDARLALGRFRSVQYHQSTECGPFKLTFSPSGSNIGACSLLVEGGGRRVVFSGNVGRACDPLMRPPDPLVHGDYLILESTYGDRVHDPSDSTQAIGEIVRNTSNRGGMVLFPAQLIGRTQAILYLLTELKWQHRIPDLPVFVDSPGAANAASILCRHLNELNLDDDLCHSACTDVSYVRSSEESDALGRRTDPMVVLAPNEMMTGGRVLRHLAQFGARPENTIVLCAFQAEGTRGRALSRNVEQLKMLGRYHPIAAEVVTLDSLSNHADHAELVAWLAQHTQAPDRVFITHGEPAPADALRRYLQDQLGWNTLAPEYLARFVL